MGLVIKKELVYLLVLKFPLHFYIVTFFPKIFKLFFEKLYALDIGYVSSFHVVCFLYKMNKSLRLHEPIPKSLLIFWPCVFFEVKYIMSRGIFWLYRLFQIKIFKIIYQVQKKIQEQLLDSKIKFAKLQMVMVARMLAKFVHFLNVVI